MKFLKRKSIKSSVARKEIKQSSYIPYKGHWDKNVIVTKNDEFFLTLKLEGFSFETADDEDLDIKKIILNTLFKSISSSQYALYFHIIRKRDVALSEGEFESDFCDELNQKWNEKHVNLVTFKNDLYLTIIKKDSDEGVGKAFSMVEKINRSANKENEYIAKKEAVKALRELASRLMGSLKSYKPYMLGIRETEHGCYSEPLEFLGKLVNAGVDSSMLVPTINVDKYISKQRVYFGKRAMEARSETGKSLFGAGVTIKEYPAYTNAGMLDCLLRLPFEFIVTQSFYFADRAAAISRMSLQQNRMRNAGDKAISQMEELSLAMDMAQSGQIAFGHHHMSIFCFNEDLEDLDTQISDIYSELVNVNISPVREEGTLLATYFAQLPCNKKFIARQSTINTLNLVGLSSLHNYPIGKKYKNHWGNALTNLDTTSGTPYYFNFHVRDVGHTTIIGPTGAGKTVLLGFFAAQAQKYKPDMFFFDKDRGAEILVRAIGGSFSILDPAKNMGFNPLQLEDTSVNRGFLVEWLSALCSESGKYNLTPEEQEAVVEAIKGNYKLSPEKRVLRNIVPFLGLNKPGSIASRVKKWHSNEVYSGIFDNDKDALSFDGQKVHGFEMAPILENPDTLGPVLLYIFHRINMTLTGSPTMIILDEAWALLDNPVFAPKIKDWLKVLRKLNGMVVFATQSPEDVANSRISETLVQQTATQIFLANMKATPVYQEVFKLSDREFALVKFTDPGSRFFLVKQGEESVVAKVDLSGLEKFVDVLSARADTIRMLDKIREKVGDNPSDWLPLFYKAIEDMNAAKEKKGAEK